MKETFEVKTCGFPSQRSRLSGRSTVDQDHFPKGKQIETDEF